MSDEEKSASDPQDHDFDRIRGARVVAGVYAPLIRRRKEKESKESCVITFPSRTIGYSVKRNNNFKHCNCKSSNCLKVSLLHVPMRRIFDLLVSDALVTWRAHSFTAIASLAVATATLIAVALTVEIMTRKNIARDEIMPSCHF